MSAPSPEAAAAELETLVSSLRSKGRDDAAFCAAHAGLYLLGESAPSTALSLATDYRPARPRRADAPIDEEAWFKLLAHPDDDPFIAKVFECVLGAVRTVRAVPLRKAGLAASDAVHPQKSSIAVVRALGSAAFALDAPLPLTFLVPSRESAIEALPTEPIASLVGARVTSGRSLEELAFLAGHHMARYRSAQYVRVLYRDSVPELTALFVAALRAARPQLAVDASVANVAQQLRKLLDAPALARLERVVELFVERGTPVDIARWVRGAEHTALRAGLLLSGDLVHARRSIELIDGARDNALSDLVQFSMSEPYWTLRQRLGIALWPDHPVAIEAPLEHVRSAPSVFPPPHELDEAIARAEAQEAEQAAQMASVERGAPEGATEPAAAEPAVASVPTLEDAVSPDAPVDALVFAAPKVPSDLSPVPPAVEERPSIALWSGGADTAVDRPTTVDPQPTIAQRVDAIRAAFDALEDPGEQTEIAQWIGALVPVLRLSFARTPEDFDAIESSAMPFAIALREASHWLGISTPIVAPFEGLGALWSAPPSTPALVLVDPSLDQALDSDARRWLAAECAAMFASKRLPLRLAPTPLLLADAVCAVASALAEQSDAAERTSANAVARHVLADQVLCDGLAPLARRLAPTVFRAATARWAQSAERGAIRQALALCDGDAPEREDAVFATRPFRAGFLGPEEWREVVAEARLESAVARARAARAS